MSSVSGSGSSDSSNRTDDVIRKIREEAKQSESEMVKKHQRELRRMNEQHYSEMEKLKDTHATQMKQLQSISNDSLSEKDHRFQKDTEDMRALQRKQMKQVADENQKREDAFNKSIRSDSNQQKTNNEQRFQRLNSDYNEKMAKRDQVHAENLEETREAQAKAIESNRNKIEKAYDEKFQTLRQERDATVGKLQDEYGHYRADATGRLKDQELRHMRAQKLGSEKLLDSVGRERAARQDSEGIMRDGFEDGLETMRNRFEKAMAKEREASAIGSEQTKSTINDRIDNQVSRLERDNAGLKDAQVRQQLKLKGEKDREISNMRDAYQKNVDNYQEQRDEVLRQSNDKNRSDVVRLSKQASKQMVNTNRFYREQMEEQNRINRDAYENLADDSKTRTEQVKSVADQRVKHIIDTTEEQKSRLIENQAENHVASQRLKQDEMRELRSTLEADKKAAVGRLQQQISNQELKHAQIMEDTIQKYEKEIVGLKDQIVREKKLSEENIRRTSEEMTRLHQVNMDQLEAKNRDRLRTINQQHSEEVRAVNRRHEERLDQVLGEVKKT
jgi:hypothetical protein